MIATCAKFSAMAWLLAFAIGLLGVGHAAEVPVSELGDYQTTLKSLTGGEGAYTMSFDHYDVVPPDVQKRLAEEYRPKDE